MHHLTFLIKPASGLCNMRCSYCFYEDESCNRAQPNAGLMTHPVVDRLIEDAFSALDAHGFVTFAFQGGEPTLSGLDYFSYFVEKVRKCNTKHVQVNYTIQTNGLLITDAWADFFARHHFLVGISIDGTKAIHDQFRPDVSGQGTWNRVCKTISLLQKKKVDVNLLCVVTRACAKNPVKVYHSLQKLGGRFLQFIPCLDPLGAPRGSMTYSLTPELYGKFLCSLFDEWFLDWKSGNYTSIRLFDDYVHLAMGLPASTCSTSGSCGAYLVVEGDGTLYPCDFYCLDRWNLGKIGEMPLERFFSGEKETAFLTQGERHPAECASCRWKQFCRGGCKRDWEAAVDGNHNYFCPAFQMFFAHASERLDLIAKIEAQSRWGSSL